jgi:hypothetical protein
MTSAITALARLLNPKNPVAVSQPTRQNSAGGLAIVTGYNTDGTIAVTYNGAKNIPVNVLGHFTPTIGKTVLLHVLGAQMWALGSPTGTGSLAPTATAGTSTPTVTTTPTTPTTTGSYLPVYNVMDYGATGLGTVSDAGAITAAAAAAIAAGGGIVFFPSGIYLVTANINLPVSTTQTAYLPGSPPIYLAPPLHFIGVGSDRQARGDNATSGSIIKITTGTPTVVITGFGAGSFEMEDISVVDASTFAVAPGNTGNTFFQFTNTVFNIHDSMFCGTTPFVCSTDFMITGWQGASTPNGGQNAIFQGYGSKCTDNTFVSMRRMLTTYSGTNTITFRDNDLANTCGTNRTGDAPIGLNTAQGNVFENNTIEMSGSNGVTQYSTYAYGAICVSASNNQFNSNGFWDAGATAAWSASTTYAFGQTAAWDEANWSSLKNGNIDNVPTSGANWSQVAIAGIYFDANSFGNTYIPGACQNASGGYLPWAAGNVSPQTSMGGQVSASGGVYTGAQPFVPIGGILLWPMTVADIPYGYFNCCAYPPGSQILQPIANFPQCFEVLGTTYGGDGVTTFGIPNLCGVFPLGASGTANVSGGTPEIVMANLPEIIGGAGGGGGIVQTNTPGSIPPGYTAAGIATGSDGFVYGPINPGGYTQAYWPPYLTMFYIMRGI